tara:strand:+ start:73 stop:1152 length:1080 start_codon:yes stop_codon:yes gene_type:complete
MSDPLFTYNQFVNPNDEGVYYSNHFHNIGNGIDVKNTHNNCSGYQGYSTHSQQSFPHLNRKWLIRENIPNNNKPIFRTHLNATDPTGTNDTLASSTASTQPVQREAADKFSFSTPRVPTTSGVYTAKKSSEASLRDITADGSISINTFSSFSSLYNLNLAQSQLQISSGSADGTGIDLSGVELNSLSNGLYSYLDYDQQGTVSIDDKGGRHMTLLPLKEPGPPAEYTFITGIRGNIGGTVLDSNIKNLLNIKPRLLFHGIPTQKDSGILKIKEKNIKETIIEDISGNHTHYFPVRGNILNGYVVNHATHNHSSNNYDDKNTEIPKFPNKNAFKYVSNKAPTLMNLNINSGRSHGNFRLF